MITAPHQPVKSVAVEIGDVVVLASGGPAMTVIGFGPDGQVQCKWKRQDGQSDVAEFPLDGLRLPPAFIEI